MSHARFQKQAREKARRDKARAKRERREARSSADVAGEPVEHGDVPQADLLAELADLHAQFGADAIGFEEFEQRKQDLLDRLDV
jgi:hypothetical protein